MIPVAKVELGREEIDIAVKALGSGRLAQGPIVEQFERAFAAKVGARHAIAVSSGTAALHIAYMCVLQPGDKVLVPTLTHIATASMVIAAGGKPVFSDVDEETLTIDTTRGYTGKMKAITPVHLFGNACNMFRAAVANFSGRGIKIVHDAAQAHGMTWKGKDIGSYPDLVCYSFYATKNMTTGEGGVICTNSDDLANKSRLLRSHGEESKYYHSMLGYNYRMTEMQAAIGLVQLQKLDSMVAKRRANAKFLLEGLGDLEEQGKLRFQKTTEGCEHSYHQFVVLVECMDRDKFREALAEKGIETAVHYPRCLHKQPVFEKMYGRINLPAAEEVSKKIVSLPVHPGLSQEDLGQIVQGVRASLAFNKARIRT